MQARINFAFWNVQNLFEPGTVGRGPQDSQELTSKIESLAGAINAFHAGAGADIVGLAEIHTSRILSELVSRLHGGPYHFIWEPSGASDLTGLAVIAKQSVVSTLSVLDVYRKPMMARPRAVIVKCSLVGVQEPFIAVINHWKSNVGSAISNRVDRMRVADWLGQWLSQQQRTTCVIVAGDFNAEPFEAPFNDLRLRTRRSFSQSLWRGRAAYLYNTAWRFLPAPDPWAKVAAAGYRETRPKTSCSNSTPRVYDQLLVSGAALRGGPLTLLDDTIELVAVDGVTSEHLPRGALVPKAWKYNPADFSGTSDHFPLTASFQVN